ncbi:ACP S-malonyltransferase [Clostridium sp. C8-1-8]|uniref:ACP S-malonyltransferase n=1 Tax=Clostridium sp. C8-1-8 TaxID=2698831 RepID=UPI0013712DE8|nr:ACP S-malonyltransferase [Clostridium sp. C8-1-8]
MKKIALLYPGQGSQYVGMGREFYERYKVFRETFEEASEVLGFNIGKLCLEGDIKKLTMTENTQPAILTMGFAMFKVYMEEIGIEPSYMAGHSLGEITALTCAGAIRFCDALTIVRNRGKFMQEAAAQGVGAMAAISNLDVSIIEELCSIYKDNGRLVVVSNYNSPSQTVISGYKEFVREVSDKLEQKGGQVSELSVSAPFHSPLMKSAAEKLEQELIKYKYEEPKYPVITNVTAMPYENSSEVVGNLIRQIVEPVRWQETIEYLDEQAIQIAIELGPKKVLTKLMKKNSNKIVAYSYDDNEEVKKLKDDISLISNVKENRMRFLTRSMAIAVCTKNNNWNNDEYKRGVIEPYKKVQNIQVELEKAAKEPTMRHMEEALEMLMSVFRTKGTSVEEQNERLNQLFNETGTRNLFLDFITQNS